MSVHRGTSVAIFTDPTRPPHPEPSSRKVQGRDTYFVEQVISLQREVLWVVNPMTMAYVIGNNLADDELLSIAEGVRVSQ